MGKSLIIPLVGLVLLWGAAPVHAQTIKVMQWNLEGHLGNPASNNTASAKAIARIINYNQPDVILLDEVEDISSLGSGTTNLNAAAFIDWVTNNVPYLGKKLGATFFISFGSLGDGATREGAITRYPMLNVTTYGDGGPNFGNLRGMHAFKVQLSGTNALQLFHAHLKADADSTSCPRRQEEAGVDATNMMNWASTNLFPYVWSCDCNEDEGPPHECTITSTYHPITTLRQGGMLVDFLPTDLTGGATATLTWSSSSPSIRFDYVLAATNRLTPMSGYVFRTSDWAFHGLYTNAGTLNGVNDSATATDHFCIQATYSFLATSTNFIVTPTGTFASGGTPGGPFSPASQTYTLTNTDVAPLFWSAATGANWLTISPTNGTLAVGWGTNITAFITNAAANALLDGIYTDTINFSNTATGVSVAGPVTLTVASVPPSASFTGSPTNGAEPLVVTFNDTSTGAITNRFWDFGDGSTTNITTNTITHTYIAGTYPVTLIASGVTGVSTDAQPNYIIVLRPPTTIGLDAADIQDRFGTLAPSNSIAVLVLDVGTNGFVDPQPAFPLGLGATWGTEDRIVGLWDLTGCGCGDGYLFDSTIVAYTNGIAPGQKLQLYWFPSLTLASNTVGATYYGKFADTNSPPLNGDPWAMPLGGSILQLDFYTEGGPGGPWPETAGQAVYLAVTPVVASFSGSPTTGTEPLSVTFTDASTGDITNWFWDFGDGNTASFITSTNPTHVYAAGTDTVMLVVSGSSGVSTNIQSNYITVLTAFQSWQVQYFGSTTNPAAAATADPDGDGCNNLCEFLSGTDPTNSASSFHITSVTRRNPDLLITWATGMGKTNVVQATTGLPNGSYATNFTDVSPLIILPPGSGDFTTNYADPGGATNAPYHYYRIRLQP
jgi:PKD repeat protein